MRPPRTPVIVDHASLLGAVGAVVLALAGGCKKTETYPAPKVAYQLFAGGFDLSTLELKIDGKPVVGAKIEVPEDYLLSDPKRTIEVTATTSCGPTPIALRSRADMTAEKAARTMTSISFELVPVAPDARPDKTKVYIDNKWTGKASTIEIGNLAIAVGEATSKTTDVYLGTCKTARTVKLDGTVVGEVPAVEPKWAALISTTKDQCYVEGIAQYGNDLMKEEDEPTNQFKQTGHVGKVRETDYPLTEPPKEIRVKQSTTAATRVTVLLSMPCELLHGDSRKAGKKP